VGQNFIKKLKNDQYLARKSISGYQKSLKSMVNDEIDNFKEVSMADKPLRAS
jgi:hypothetical protein